MSNSPLSFSNTLGYDFIIPNKTFNIAPEEQQVEVNITIVDDTIAEDNETFTLEVITHLVGVTFLQTLQARVTILDDEGIAAI